MAVYSLNGRVFWPLLTGACTLLLCLLQTLRGRAGPTGGEAGWPSGLGELPLPVPLLLLLLVLLAALGLSQRAWWTARRRQRGAQRSPGVCGGREARRRALLDGFYETRLRLSPHVLGHSKAHVSLVVGELLRAGKAAGRLSLRGDAVQVGSAYEQHKVSSPDGFDVLVPLRLPPWLELRALPCGPQDQPQRQPGARGLFLCALQVAQGGQGSPSRALCVAASPGEADGASLLSAALVARWFQAQVQRCLGAVRARLQERCRVRLAVGVAAPCPLALNIVPCSDYVCCHLSLTVHLTPAIPLGEGLYLTPCVCCPQRSAAPQLGTFWTLNLSKAEQRLLAWLRDQVPADSCHLRCLQILKGLRELGGRALEPPWAAQWDRILSSYVLKTALFWVLLRSPWQAWEDRFLVARLEDMVLFLVQALQRGRLAHLFLGNPHLPEILSLPKFVKEASPVNLLADFDRPALERVASQLLSVWKQAPKIIRMYGGHRYRKQHLT